MPLTAESAARKDRTTANGGPELQHRHFAFIAAVFAENKPSDDDSDLFAAGVYADWKMLVGKFADACAASNPRFDRRRFMVACGLQS